MFQTVASVLGSVKDTSILWKREKRVTMNWLAEPAISGEFSK